MSNSIPSATADDAVPVIVLDHSLTTYGPLAAAGRACCCPAMPMYRVILTVPPGIKSTDLLLCGHHYVKSRATFSGLHALVFDAAGSLVAS